MSGCISPSPEPAARATRTLPSYRELIERYNRNLEDIKQLWSFATIEIDNDGFQQGDAQLQVVRPSRASLSVEKAGVVHLLIGCNERQYWLFDLRDPDEKQLFFGSHSKVAKFKLDALHLAFSPRDLIRLLGIVPIDPKCVPAKHAVEWHLGNYLIEPPGTRCRMLLEPDKAQPQRIDLLDDRGYSRVVASLSAYRPLKTDDLSPGRWPVMATRMTIMQVGAKDRIRLVLSELVGNKNAINPSWFDLETLKNVHRPDKVVDMDKDEVPSLTGG